jgi:hypothetical protein
MQNNKKIGFWLDVVILILLLLAIPDWDYGFYEFARPCLGILLGWSAIISFVVGGVAGTQFSIISAIVKFFLAVAFMPKDIGPYLEKEVWVMIDIASAIFMIACLINKLKKDD